MSKTIAEVYEEVIKSAELQKEFLEAEQSGTIAAFAAAHGCEATAEEVQAFLKGKLNEDKELSLDELDQVAGGKAKQEGPACPACGSTNTKVASNSGKIENGKRWYLYICKNCRNTFWVGI